MLKSKQVLDAFASLLAASPDFQVIGSPDANYDESESAFLPIVELHIPDGNFHDRGSSVYGKKTHSFKIQVSIIASARSSYDLALINNPGSTPEQIATAITAGQTATHNAFVSAYDILSLVFSFINNAQNYDLGMDEFEIKDKRYSDYKMSKPVLTGNMATVTIVSSIDCIVEEDTTGLTPVASEEPPVKGVVDGTLP